MYGLTSIPIGMFVCFGGSLRAGPPLIEGGAPQIIKLNLLPVPVYFDADFLGAQDVCVIQLYGPLLASSLVASPPSRAGRLPVMNA